MLLLLTGCNEETNNNGSIVITNNAPNKPTIVADKAIDGQSNIYYSFSVSSIDPDKDNVSFIIDFGDESVDSSSRFVQSGENYTFNHLWDSSGSFKIKARAFDDKGLSSEWSEISVQIEKKTAPDFTISTIDGIDFTLSENIGKVVLINFVATQCFGCSCVLENLKDFYNNIEEDVVAIVIDIWFFSNEETLENLESLKNEINIDCFYAMDSKEVYAISKYFESPDLGISPPLTFIVDNNGFLVFGKNGCFDYGALNDEINKYL
jgi:peroxiredoxin